MTISSKYLESQRGLSLIELLVSMLLGSLVMIFVAQIFMSSFSSKRLLNAEAELQENARFGLSVINSIIQSSGGFGCRTTQQTNTHSLLDFKDPTFTPWQVIEGWEAANTQYGEAYTAQSGAPVLNVANGGWKSSAGAEIDKGLTAVKNTDILKVWYMKGSSVALNSAKDGELTFSAIDIEQGDVLIVNDCKTVTFVQACACEGADTPECAGQDTIADIAAGSCNSPGNTSHDFNDINLATAEVGVLQQAIFFVSKPNGSAGGMPTLYVSRLGNDAKRGEPEEVLTDVENLQVLFGEDTTSDNSPNYYVSGDSVDDWKNVVSIKISLLLRSKENFILPDNQKVVFNGVPVKMPKNDRYLRRVYSSTISLRNRNIGY